MFLVPLFVFLIGAAIVIGTILSAVRTFVVPRGAQDWLNPRGLLDGASVFRSRESLGAHLHRA